MIGSSLKKLWGKVSQPYTKKLLIVACFIVACLTLVAFSINEEYDVQVNLNGHEMQVTTQAKTVQELLQKLGIAYTYQDQIDPELNTELESDMTITWKQAKQLSVIRYGTLESVWTTAQTVGEFIEEQGIELEDENIEVKPDPHHRLYSNQWVEIAEVYETTEEEEFTVPYQTVRRDDPNMLQGQEKKVADGKDGLGKNVYQVSYRNGFQTQREKVETHVIEEKKDEIVAVGTMASVSRGGYVFAPRSVLEDVTLTAYSAGEAHTGKTADHPQYGITRSGARVEEGRTIAVDPNVIPLGTWVYIEDIGLRKAEDTGGAIKGNKIDVYYDSDSTARNFGVKRNYKVYIIGKNKPAALE
ncbi:3D domain-containing protein [Bacillus horti]|uniref:Uncharacterized protein YabE (DUF348 family) n=1 Tax=Caldalkalibacillus horti TaxID=77523 RepID=A0ABT9W3C2_9BACI|nr:3D domain-containing protein [Bacillus horti]MDQ0167567.1 uncharacterized protein YabE (DUF348 family) [Bacillus horti]